VTDTKQKKNSTYFSKHARHTSTSCSGLAMMVLTVISEVF